MGKESGFKQDMIKIPEEKKKKKLTAADRDI